MWKISVSALLSSLVFSAAARAEWAQVSKDDFSTVYMDPASKRILSDGTLTVDALTDYDPASPNAKAFGLAEKGLSEIEKVSLDCANRKYKSEGGYWREGPMGVGKTTRTYPSKDSWAPVPAYYDGLFAKACSIDPSK